MVPANHAAWIVVSSANKHTYFGRAENCTGEWECFVWHGGGYGLTGERGKAANGFLVDTAMRTIRALCGTQFIVSGKLVPPDLTDWALFYWCNRYMMFLDSSGTARVFERFKFIRRQRVLDL